MPATKDLPSPPRLLTSIGPSFILLGLALGSGELIMWPYLTSLWGLGLLWGALLGITFQFFLNTEVMRYTLAWGESVFVGLRRSSKIFPYWFILSTFIPWSLPGFSSASAHILTRVLGIPNETALTIGLLLLVGVVLTFGKTLYRTMEQLQRTLIQVGLPFILFLALIVVRGNTLAEMTRGLVGMGNNWWFFPPGIALATFLGAVAFSGAGGNLNLAQSYYIKEKGFGMGKYGSKITSLFARGNEEIRLEGETFSATAENRRRWQGWWRVVNGEHFFVFWVLGFLTILLTTLLSRSLIFGQASASGIEFLFQEGAILSGSLTPTLGTLFLLVAASMLLSTQIGVLESSTRIISENLLLIVCKPGSNTNPSLAFYLTLWAQILFGVVLILFHVQEPRYLLTLSALLNAAAMMVAFPLVFTLNRKRLAAFSRAGRLRQAVLAGAFLFYAVFLTLTLRDLRI